MKAGKTSGGGSNSTRKRRRAVARAGGRHRPPWRTAAESFVAVALLVIVIVAVRMATRNNISMNSRAALNAPPATLAVGANTPPPWPAPSNATAAVAAAGLPMLHSEGAAEHIHAHLDMFVEGHSIRVPADIGIDRARRTISPVHTHDDTGVIHIESPVQRQFSLGEFFTEWGVSLSADNIGALRATGGRSLRVYVDGTLRPGNPAAITFGPHEEIALIYGIAQPGESPPGAFDFGSGL
jgi:hypothetical protein